VLARNGGGAFVNVLSGYSWVAMPLLSTYAASKAAAWNLTNAACIELKRQGTAVVAVHSGFVDTDLTAPLDVEKTSAAMVAASALDALQAVKPEADHSTLGSVHRGRAQRTRADHPGRAGGAIIAAIVRRSGCGRVSARG
jgi:short-subunit dehydrogenase